MEPAQRLPVTASAPSDRNRSRVGWMRQVGTRLVRWQAEQHTSRRFGSSKPTPLNQDCTSGIPCILRTGSSVMPFKSMSGGERRDGDRSSVVCALRRALCLWGCG